MILVLTMAGKYTRFREFSYEIPKYLLPLSNRTILYHVLNCFSSCKDFKGVLLVANKRDYRFKSQIARTLSEFGFNTKSIIFIEDTVGQSETALIGMKVLQASTEYKSATAPVVIHNIDTILLNRDFDKYIERLKNTDCLIDIFNSRNPAYSYVLTTEDEPEEVAHIVEKQVISNTASSGCYAFKSLAIATKYLSAPLRSHYISDAIAGMVAAAMSVQVTTPHLENDTIVLGTPEEYINSMEYFDLIISGDTDGS